MRSLVRTKPGAVGQSHHSLGLSCARPVLTRSQAELAFERPREIREIVEADGVGDFLGQCAWMGEAFAGPLQPVAQQMLAEACALLAHATHIQCAACALVQHCARITRQVDPEKTRITRRARGIASQETKLPGPDFQFPATTGVITKPSVVARRFRAATLRASCCSS